MTGSVTVACKVPMGLRLRLFKIVEGSELVMGGGSRKIKVAEQVGSEVVINGPSVPHGRSAPYPIVAGFALTSNVDADFFQAWEKQNADLEVVKAGLIFAYEKVSDSEACAREHEKLRSGLEPLDPDKPMRGIQKAVKEAA